MSQKRVDVWKIRSHHISKPKVDTSNKTLHFLQCRELEYRGKQNFESTNDTLGSNVIKCFKCDWGGHMPWDCTYDTKEDGSALNSKEETNQKYDSGIITKCGMLHKATKEQHQ